MKNLLNENRQSEVTLSLTVKELLDLLNKIDLESYEYGFLKALDSMEKAGNLFSLDPIDNQVDDRVSERKGIYSVKNSNLIDLLGTIPGIEFTFGKDAMNVLIDQVSNKSADEGFLDAVNITKDQYQIDLEDIRIIAC